MKMGEMILDFISSNRLQIYRKRYYTENGKRIHPQAGRSRPQVGVKLKKKSFEGPKLEKITKFKVKF
jgi:hypothetical protein